MAENEKLAEAMVRLAEALDKVSNPETWRVIMEIGATRLAEGLREIQYAAPISIGLPPPGEVRAGQVDPRVGPGRYSISVTLAPEERARMTAIVVEALKPQIAQFQSFVQLAVSELPADKLKEATNRIEAGKPVTIERRRGCVFLHFPEDDPTSSESFHLRL